MNTVTALSWLPYVLIPLIVVALAATFWALTVRNKRRAGSSIEELRRQAAGSTTRPEVAKRPGQPPSAGTGPGSVSPASVSPAKVTPILPTLDTPEASGTRLARLRSRLAKSGSPFGTKLLNLLSRDHLTDADWDVLEETLLVADVGAGPAAELVAALKTRVRVEGASDPARVKAILREELIRLVDPTMDRSLNLGTHHPASRHSAASLVEAQNAESSVPAVVLVIGVNGTGKTTTIGKLARVLVADGKTVLLGAADTFRAAAADQLQTWGSKVGVRTIRSQKDGADPAAVAFEAVKIGKAEGVDVVLIDTAGRLQNKQGLMDELGKITRVIEKEAPISEVLLVLDATTGQNGMQQARVFSAVAGVTGIVLTKLDGTARGGIVIAVQRELGVPVKLVGLGEGPDDLAPFDPTQFVEGILGE